MMEALRSFGVAARFVTGYLYDDTSGTTRGGGSTHAWCNVYLPGAGWMEYDPTNGLIAGSNLVRVGVARSAAQALPVAGQVGDSVAILGTGLDEATAVSFNGVAATFNLVSPTQLNATVLVGASTGYIEVTLPSGNVLENLPFRVEAGRAADHADLGRRGERP